MYLCIIINKIELKYIIMAEITVKTINWFDIKDDVKIIKEDKVSKCIKSHNVVMHHKNNVNTLDGSINVNHAICKKVTAKNIEPFESILVYNQNDKVKYHCEGTLDMSKVPTNREVQGRKTAKDENTQVFYDVRHGVYRSYQKDKLVEIISKKK